MNDHLAIRLLGGFEVVRGAQPVTAFESSSARALLARLAADPGVPFARAELAELLWPGRAERAALANLRHALSVVRRTIGDHERGRPVLVSTESVRLDPTADVSVDLSELHRLAHTPPSAVGAVAAWDRAVDLRRGPFLAGFETSFSPEWDEWVTAMRRATDETVMSVLRRLAEVLERSGERDRLRHHLSTWLQIDPWDERAHRLVIRDLANDGRIAAAIAHAEQLVDELEQELGVDPRAETVELIDQLRRGSFPSATTRRAAARSVSRPDAAPCVGRDEERQLLARRLDDAVGGTGSLVFVVGEAGAGKTVLLRAAVSDACARMERLVIASGSCNAYAGRGDPLLPFRQVLAMLCGTGGFEPPVVEAQAPDDVDTDVVRATVEAIVEHGPDLLDTVVDSRALVERFIGLEGEAGEAMRERLERAVATAAVRSSDPTRRQYPLLDQCVQVLLRVAKHRPLMVVIDDLQWADAGSLDLLGHLASRVSRGSILVVAALRPPDMVAEGREGPVESLADVRSQVGADCTIELTGTREFVDAWLDREPNLLDEEFRARVHDLTAGHPLFTVEMVRSMCEHGQLRRDHLGRWVETSADEWSELPPRIEATIGARLARLPMQARRDLEAASVQGDVFTSEVVAAVRGVPVGTISERLAGLDAGPHSLVGPARAVRLGTEPVHGWRFRHTLFRQHLYEHLDAGTRTALHESSANALAELAGDDADSIAAELAHHFDAAGSLDEAITAHEHAGRRALRLAANVEAASHFERALELLDARPRTPDRDHTELVVLTELGACQQVLSGYTSASTVATYERLRALVAAAPPSTESMQALGAIMTVDGMRARYGDAITGARRLLADAERAQLAPIAALAHVQLGWTLLMTGNLVEAEHHLRLADEGFDPSWDDWLTWSFGQSVQVATLAWRSIVAWHLGNFDDARRFGDASITVARRLGHPFTLGFALSVGGCLRWMLLGEADPCRRAADEVGALAEERDIEWYRGAALVHHGSAMWLAGRRREGIDESAAGFAKWAALGTDAFAIWALTHRVETMVRGGFLDEAAAAIATIEEGLDTGEERLAELRLPLVRGMLMWARGDLGAAEDQLRAAVAAANERRAGGSELQASVELARLLGDLDRTDEALDLIRPALGLVDDTEPGRDMLTARQLVERLDARITGAEPRTATHTDPMEVP